MGSSPREWGIYQWYKSKDLLNICIYSHRPELLSTLVREICLCSEENSMKSWIATKSVENTILSAQTQTEHLPQPLVPPARLRGHHRRGGRNNVRAREWEGLL